MQAASTSIVRVRLTANMPYGVPADYLKRFADGTALVRFAAGNFRIVRIDLIEPATDAEEREYYRVRESSPPCRAEKKRCGTPPNRVTFQS